MSATWRRKAIIVGFVISCIIVSFALVWLVKTANLPESKSAFDREYLLSPEYLCGPMPAFIEGVDGVLASDCSAETKLTILNEITIRSRDIRRALVAKMSKDRGLHLIEDSVYHKVRRD
jgi:hypothetical protein